MLRLQTLTRLSAQDHPQHRNPENHRRIPRPEQSLMVRRGLFHDIRRLTVHMGKALQVPAHQAVVLDRHLDL